MHTRVIRGRNGTNPECMCRIFWEMPTWIEMRGGKSSSVCLQLRALVLVVWNIWFIIPFTAKSVLRRVQSELSGGWDLAFPLSYFSIPSFNQGHPVAA
jgi:hypothetical protein